MIRGIRDPELRAAVLAAYLAWRKLRDQETGQLALAFDEETT